MNEAIRMQISAFVDGELPENETELLLRRLCQDAELRSQVASYMAIGHALRGDAQLSGMARLRAGIAEELGQDRAPVAEPAGSVPTRFLRPVAGVAVAATVAIVALVGLRQVGPADEPGAQSLEDLSAVAIDGGPSYTEPPVTDSMSNRPRDMLTLYYLHHGQQSSNFGSRLVGLEVRQDRLAADAPADNVVEDEDQGPDAPAEPAAREVQEETDLAQ